MITRSQLEAAGLTPGAVEARRKSGRWTDLHPGVYLTFTGPVSASARVWAALLTCGEEAAIGGRTALWLWGAWDAPEAVITVCVPERRRVTPPAGIRAVRRRRLADRVHPAALPRRLRIEDALLDVTDEAKVEGDVIDLALRTIAGRRTTPLRVRESLSTRHQHRHRSLLLDLLEETAAGVQSPLERRYRQGVELAHGLPRGERNTPESVVGGTGARRTRYRDVRYRRWRVVIELDGLETHPVWMLRRDRARDNSATLAGDSVLVYGWHEVVADRCQVAVQVIQVLWRQGWRGTPRPCGTGCPVGELLAARP